uniref:Uncharacterized protein n=1 Tax=Anguilla anguilla TaxID=7936 RepID=A0A0E9P595_ANGAN
MARLVTSVSASTCQILDKS